MAERPRMQVLSRRVQWIDRWRHPLALLATLAVTPLAIWQMSLAIELDWLVIQVIFGVMLAAVVWTAFEIAFAGIAAAWDTERENMLRASKLPPVARLLRRRRRRR